MRRQNRGFAAVRQSLMRGCGAYLRKAVIREARDRSQAEPAPRPFAFAQGVHRSKWSTGPVRPPGGGRGSPLQEYLGAAVAGLTLGHGLVIDGLAVAHRFDMDLGSGNPCPDQRLG